MTGKAVIQMTPLQAERLKWVIERGEFSDIGVVGVDIRLYSSTASTAPIDPPQASPCQSTSSPNTGCSNDRSRPSLVEDLINAGIHFGQRSGGWNPKMAPYIYGKRNGIHIIDIKETVKGLLLAKRFITQTVGGGKDICFVGTKRQAKTVIEQRVGELGMHYVTERWLGGALTNFRTIRARLKRLEELEAIETEDNFQSYSKKMESQLRREMKKIKRNLDGLRRMDKLPGAMVVIDVRRETTALKEARKLGIPTICLIDTDGDPEMADIPIPGNDDSMRSIDVIIRELCAAVAEGKQQRSQRPQDAGGEESGSGESQRRRSSRAQFRADGHDAQPGSDDAGPDESGGMATPDPDVATYL